MVEHAVVLEVEKLIRLTLVNKGKRVFQEPMFDNFRWLNSTSLNGWNGWTVNLSFAVSSKASSINPKNTWLITHRQTRSAVRHLTVVGGENARSETSATILNIFHGL